MKLHALALAAALSLPVFPALAADPPGKAPGRIDAKPVPALNRLTIGFIGTDDPPATPLSFLDPLIRDGGRQGARLGVQDGNTTGRFLKREFILAEGREADVPGLLAQGVRVIVADLPADALLRVADLAAAQGAVVLNARARDDGLRNAQCRANLFHTIPSRRMLADALGQYLVTRRWTSWFLVTGAGPGDKPYADAIRRTAKRLGAKIVEEKDWTFDVGHARTDDGFSNERDVVATFTRGADHDVLIVADEEGAFGDYLSHRTARPRPVAGTAELVPTSCSRVFEQWGGTQLQNRFQALAGRIMTERDYAAWVAVRAVTEAAVKVPGGDVAAVLTALRDPGFTLAAFKGQALSFRGWDGQLRQPILIANPRLLVSVSPQDGFLHQRTPLDSLGDDEGESGCTARGR